jgi:hypothetical protein
VTSPAPDGPSRRTLLVGLAAAGLAAACGRDSPREAPAAPEQPAAPRAAGPTAEPPPSPEPEPVQRYLPVDDEVFPDAKTVAAELALGLCTYRAGEDPATVVARAVQGVGATGSVDEASMRSTASDLLAVDADSRALVEYPQLGGLAPLPSAGRPRAASIMVVLRQILQVPGEPEQVVVRTLDVRVSDPGDGWVLDSLADAGGSLAPRPASVSAAAAAVLDDERITLPDSARWDIHRGEADPTLKISERLLTTMADVADIAPYRVTCLRSGHPQYVFDGSANRRTSQHFTGRAVDIWSVDDRPVVQQRGDVESPAFAFHEVLFREADLSQLGAPQAAGTPAEGEWDLDGVPGASRPTFVNAVHDDHLHLAYSRG